MAPCCHTKRETGPHSFGSLRGEVRGEADILKKSLEERLCKFLLNTLHFLEVVRRMIVYSGLRRAELRLAYAVENGKWFQVWGHGMLTSTGPR